VLLNCTPAFVLSFSSVASGSVFVTKHVALFTENMRLCYAYGPAVQAASCGDGNLTSKAANCACVALNDDRLAPFKRALDIQTPRKRAPHP
jgi:hypothetical protein